MKTMDFRQQIATAIQEKLDMPTAFPVIHDMKLEEIEDFVEKKVVEIFEGIDAAMSNGRGDSFVYNDDALGLAVHIMREGVNLSLNILLDLSKDIINKSRRTCREIAYNDDGYSLWYAKLYIDLSKDEVGKNS
jgi:hypothetical protein